MIATDTYQLMLNGMYYKSTMNYIPLNGVKYTLYIDKYIINNPTLTLSPQRNTSYTPKRNTSYSPVNRLLEPKK